MAFSLTDHAPVNQASLKKQEMILHRGFVEIRNLALRKAYQQIFDLADTFEIIPAMMENWEEGNLDRVRALLQEYQDKYPGFAFDYVSMLNMSDDKFLEVYDSRVSF